MEYLKKFFKGRINKKEFSIYFLGLNLGMVILFVMYNNIIQYLSTTFAILIIIIVVSLFWFLILSIVVKRFHDIGKSGVNTFWLLVGIVNIYFLIILFFQKSNVVENKYGQYVDRKTSFSNLFNFN